MLYMRFNLGAYRFSIGLTWNGETPYVFIVLVDLNLIPPVDVDPDGECTVQSFCVVSVKVILQNWDLRVDVLKYQLKYEIKFRISKSNRFSI